MISAVDLSEIRKSPREGGSVELIVRRPAVEEREVVEEAERVRCQVLGGDCGLERGSKSMPDGSANPDAQLTVMNARAAALIAGERERWPLAGDQLFIDLDLSGENVPAGTRLELG